MNEPTNNLDASLRRKLLQELSSATPPPGGWAALKRELEGDADLQLRSALTGLAESSATGWQALERKLDPRSGQEANLADRLNSLQPAQVPGSWEVLTARMDAEKDQQIDAIVSDRLARAGAGSTSGWAALAARLELIGWRRGVVSAWKIMEGAFLLSFILLLLRFGPLGMAPVTPVAQKDTAAPPVRETENNLPPAAVAMTSVSERVVDQRTIVATTNAPKPLPAPLPTEVNITPAIPEITSAPELEIVQEHYLVEMTIPALSIEPLKKSVRLPSPALHLPEIAHGEPVRYYVNAFISPFDINQVVTPATAIGQFDISGDQRFTQGGSVGLLFEVQQGKNGLEIGAIYSRRSYIPSALKWFLQDEYEHTAFEPIKGYSRFRYENITFPFNYNRTVLERPNWRVSARVGMSLSIIARSSFYGQEDVVAGFNALAERAGDGTASARSSREVDFSGRHRLENPPKGWLEGGSILTNSSFYLNGGIVVERLLDPRWSVYVSPSFGRVVYLEKDQGIGPYSDRIHVGSLRFGSRYLFGGK